MLKDKRGRLGARSGTSVSLMVSRLITVDCNQRRQELTEIIVRVYNDLYTPLGGRISSEIRRSPIELYSWRWFSEEINEFPPSV